MTTPDRSAGAPTRPPLEPDWQADVHSALGLAIDVASASASQHGRPLHLSPTEFALLQVLARHHRSVVPGEELARLVAGESGYRSNAVAVHVSRLRRKIGAGLIRTIRARGYMLGSAVCSTTATCERG